MSGFKLDKNQVRRHFGAAAQRYEKHDVLQRQVQALLLDRLSFYLAQPRIVLDVGAGTGRGTAQLKKRLPKAQVLALDSALPMLHAARRQSTWRYPFGRVCADATQLPLPDQSVDVLHSNLCFQWVDDPDRLFAECARVLSPEGMLVFSSFGPDTLKELRAAWAAVDEMPHVSRFLDMHDLGDAMLRAGLRDPVLDVERFTLTYSEPGNLLQELRALGASNADATRMRGLAGKSRYRAMLDAYETMRINGCIPSTWEVITAHAWGVPPGQSRRTSDGEVASFPIHRLRGTHRRGG